MRGNVWRSEERDEVWGSLQGGWWNVIEKNRAWLSVVEVDEVWWSVEEYGDYGRVWTIVVMCWCMVECGQERMW